MPPSARRFAQDRRGNVSILAAFGLIAMTGFAALGVDLGSIFADRRRLQAMTDLAAITAASNLQKAKAGAAATLQKNNIPASALVSVETGAYTPTPLLGPDKRFDPSSGITANAARVTLQSQTPLFFGKLVTGSDSYTINTTATAATTAMASFAIGSRLASLNAGLLNSILGSMLGTTLSLSVMDYQSLLDAKIDALAFLKSLASKVNVTAGTYTDLLNTSASISNILQAVLATQKNASGTTNATAALTSLTQSASLLTAKVSDHVARRSRTLWRPADR